MTTSNRAHWLLWFDVETRYKTTRSLLLRIIIPLWFDVETRYKTTTEGLKEPSACCGLM